MRPINYLAAAAILFFLASPLFAQDSAQKNSKGYVQTWGPNVGEPLPVLTAFDQAGMAQTLDTLSGSQGLLLFLNRSADW